MATLARAKFDSNCADIKRLFAFKPPTGQKKIEETEVLNKSAVVLITAFWEAYCEDLAAEGLEHLVVHADGWEAVPKDLQKKVAKELNEELNEVAVWQLADEGWRDVLMSRLEVLRQERNREISNPKTGPIDDLFEDALGIRRISSSWHWQGMKAKDAAAKLDRFISLRGDIAHRGVAADRVSRSHARDYLRHVKALAGKTGGRVNAVVKKATGKPLWDPPLQSVFKSADEAMVKRLLRTLTADERELLRLRFGIDNLRDLRLSLDEPSQMRTLEEISQLLGVTRDQAQLMESHILSKMRHPSRAQYLGEDWELRSTRRKLH